jgi:hypothetical protein
VTLTQSLLAPVFLHILLTAWIGVSLGRARFKSARAKEVRREDIALNNKAWPDHVLKFSNNFDSQFQVPLLWYAGVGLLLITGLADQVAVALSWLFVASRLAHTFIHTGANVVINRFRAFLFGFIAVLALWLWFAIRLYVIG